MAKQRKLEWAKACWDALGLMAIGWVLLGMGVGVWSLRKLPLESVEVLGLHRLNADDVLRHAKVGGNLGWLEVDGHKLALRLLGHGTIARVNVWKPLAGHLRVRLYEREPNFKVASAGDWLVLDSERVVLARVVMDEEKRGTAKVQALPGFEGIGFEGYKLDIGLSTVVGGDTEVRLGRPLQDDATESGLAVLQVAWEAGWPVNKPLWVNAKKPYQVEVQGLEGQRLRFEAEYADEAFNTWLRVLRVRPLLLEQNTLMDMIGQERRLKQGFVLQYGLPEYATEHP